MITICPFENRKISGFQSQAHHIAAGCHWRIWLHTHVGVFVHVGFQLRGESQYFTICHVDELARHESGRGHGILGDIYSFAVLFWGRYTTAMESPA